MNVKVEKLTKEAFAPYGQIITREGREDKGNPATHGWYPQLVTREEPTSINLLNVYPREFTNKTFEAHDYTEETLLPMNGSVIVVLMPKDQFGVENMKAFLVPQGTGVSLAPGTWHYVPFPMGQEVQLAVIFKNGTSTSDIYFRDLDEEVGVEL